MTPYRVVCRLGDCDCDERFGTVDAVHRSEWSKLSPFSLHNSNGEREMRGYCPCHAVEADSA